jgi:hypothetical protein
VKNLDALQKAWKTLDIERYHLEGEVRAAKVPSVPHIINPKEIKQLVDKATILVTRGGKVYAYPDYDPDSEHYTHSSLFNQVHSELETEETGDYVNQFAPQSLRLRWVRGEAIYLDSQYIS